MVCCHKTFQHGGFMGWLALSAALASLGTLWLLLPKDMTPKYTWQSQGLSDGCPTLYVDCSQLKERMIHQHYTVVDQSEFNMQQSNNRNWLMSCGFLRMNLGCVCFCEFTVLLYVFWLRQLELHVNKRDDFSHSFHVIPSSLSFDKWWKKPMKVKNNFIGANKAE